MSVAHLISTEMEKTEEYKVLMVLSLSPKPGLNMMTQTEK